MNDLEEKINQLKWLKAIGVNYYCSEHSELEAQSAHNLLTVSESEKLSESFYDKLVEHNSMERSRSLVDSVTTLEELKECLLNFDGCNLKNFANNTVFGDGNPKGSFMIIGEAPGASEDKEGIPFCGESGKLLDNMLKTVGISRAANAYITNTVFWRPPANRPPTAEEISICLPFVEKHIAIINPKLIILVGSTAATGLLGKHAGITKIRQEYYSYSNKYLTSPIHTTALFHPAYLLRQPMQKKTSWYDLLKIQAFAAKNFT